MPRIAPIAELAKLQRKVEVEERSRFVDLAVRLRLLTPEGEPPGPLIDLPAPGVIGGRWDKWGGPNGTGAWVTPTPADINAVEWTIQEQQIPLFLETPPETKLVAIFGGRQSGKSRVSLMEVARDALRFPGWESFIVSQDFKASAEVRDNFAALLDPSWGVRWSASERTFTFPHGHLVKLRSAENIAACRGPSIKTLVLDEASLYPEAVYLAAVGSGMASKSFRLLLPTTPKREVKWIRDVYQDWGTSAVKGSQVFHLETEKNPRHDKAFLENVARTVAADLYDQEFRGKLVQPPNAVYASLFKRGIHVQAPGQFEGPATKYLRETLRDINGPVRLEDITQRWTFQQFNESADYIIGWDFGHEAAAILKVFRDTRLIHERDPADPRRVRSRRAVRTWLWVVGDAVDPNATTEHHGRRVADEYGTNAIVVTDAMGAYDNSDGGRWTGARIKVLRRVGFKKVLPVAKHNPDVGHRIETVRHLLCNCKRTPEEPEGQRRLFVSPTAKHVIDALENQRMVHGVPEKDDLHEHIADALGYGCVRAMPVEGLVPAGVQVESPERESA